MKLKRSYKHKHPKYKTEAERKNAKLEANKRYFERNKDAIMEYSRNYNREKYREEQKAKGLTVKIYKRKKQRA